MSIYERYKLYHLNPCDLDVLPVLKPIAKALTTLNKAFAVNCPCCQGARIALGLTLAFLAGRYLA
jgi:hypothetical protein